jgi:hypothetical protein
MKVMLDRPTGQVDLSCDRAGLSGLAALVASGTGTMAGEEATSPWGETPLTRIAVRTEGDRVLITADAATRTLTITGAREHLRVLAEILADVAGATDGGHVHIEHYPDHPYLAEGAAPLVVSSPLGGMPLRP